MNQRYWDKPYNTSTCLSLARRPLPGREVDEAALWLGRQGAGGFFPFTRGSSERGLNAGRRFVFRGCSQRAVRTCIMMCIKKQPFSYIHSSAIIQYDILPSHTFYLFYKLPRSYDYVSAYVPLARLRTN